jgi:hypothetical protein
VKRLIQEQAALDRPETKTNEGTSPGQRHLSTFRG